MGCCEPNRGRGCGCRETEPAFLQSALQLDRDRLEHGRCDCNERGRRDFVFELNERDRDDRRDHDRCGRNECGCHRGERGERGPMGHRGERGERGERGPMGPRGFDGPRGQTGFRGEKGDRGPMGPRGFDGEKGEKGERGPRGQDGCDGFIESAFGSLYNREPVCRHLEDCCVKLHLDTGKDLKDFKVCDENLIAEECGWYLVTYDVDFSTDDCGRVSFELEDCFDKEIALSKFKVDTKAKELMEVSKSVLVFLKKDEGIHLSAKAKCGSELFIPEKGAVITAVKIGDGYDPRADQS